MSVINSYIVYLVLFMFQCYPEFSSEERVQQMAIHEQQKLSESINKPFCQ